MPNPPPGVDPSHDIEKRERQYGNTTTLVIDHSQYSLFSQAMEGKVKIKSSRQITMSYLQIVIENNTDQPATITIPPGTMIKPTNPSLQDIVVTHEKTIIIPPKKQVTQKILTACANLHRGSPSNQPSLITKFRNPEIKQGMSQNQIWKAVEQKVVANKIQKERIKDTILKTSAKLFQLIENKTLKLQDVQIEDDHLILQIQNPITKGYGLFPQNNKLSRKEAQKILKNVDAQFVFGKVRTAANQKSTKISFPMSSQDVDPDSKFDVVFQKDGLKRLVSSW